MVMLECNRLICGDAVTVLAALPDACVHLIVTSPRYWNVVNYGDGQPPLTYGDYLDGMDPVWSECERVRWK
jgi:modification methylase